MLSRLVYAFASSVELLPSNFRLYRIDEKRNRRDSITLMQLVEYHTNDANVPSEFSLPTAIRHQSTANTQPPSPCQASQVEASHSEQVNDETETIIASHPDQRCFQDTDGILGNHTDDRAHYHIRVETASTPRSKPPQTTTAHQIPHQPPWPT